MVKDSAFLLSLRIKQGCLFSTLLLNVMAEMQCDIRGLQEGRTEKRETKGIRLGKKEQNSSFADNIILYVENPKKSTHTQKNLLGLKN